jgi:hypothetical protein
LQLSRDTLVVRVERLDTVERVNAVLQEHGLKRIENEREFAEMLDYYMKKYGKNYVSIFITV